jgi:hypothetical protein
MQKMQLNTLIIIIVCFDDVMIRKEFNLEDKMIQVIKEMEKKKSNQSIRRV